MNRQVIKIKTDKQIEALTPILVLNGYTVRVATIKKANSNTKKKALEYWEEENK